MNFPRNLRLAASSICALALVVGCSSSSTPTPAPQSAAPVVTPAPVVTQAAPASEAASAAASAEAKGPCFDSAKKEFTVAMVRWDPADIYFNGVQLGEQIEHDRILKDCGVTINWKLFGSDDSSKQLTALQSYLAAGVDGVDLEPFDGAAFTSIAKEINAKNLPLVVHDVDVPGAQEVFAGFDNLAAGKLGGDAAIAALNAARGTGWQQQEGVFIVLRCIVGDAFDIGRTNGYHSAFDAIVAASGGKIKVETQEVGCNDSKARTATDGIIARYGQDKILGVFAIDGDSGFGALSALKARNMVVAKTDPKFIPVVAVDGSEAEMSSIAKGEMLTAAVQPAVAAGVLAERLLYQELATGKLLTKPATDGATYDMPDYVGAPWGPVKIVSGPEYDGPWYQTSTYDVASIGLDNHWQWANMLDQSKTGAWPHYTDQGCVSGCPNS